MKLKTPKGKVYIALMAALATGATHAQEVQQLATTVVKAANESAVSHTIKEISADDISKKSLSDIEDTTRYIPGVQVNDVGNRFGDNGFNIRGLQGNAVAVTVDGVSLGETLAPANFSAYGMYDSTRGQVELEHVKEITITKGPSSVINGESALAGSVAYTTNDASDFIEAQGNDTSVKLKTGYDSRDSETLLHGTFANRTGKLESLIQLTVRDGNELEAHDDGERIIEPASATEVADSFDVESEAILAKFVYEIDDDMRIGVLFDQVERTTEGTPESRNSSTYFDFVTDDENNKTRYGLFFTWDNADNVAFDNMSVTLDQQELFTSGVTSFGFSSRGVSYLRREDRSTEQNFTTLNVDFEKLIVGDISHEILYGFTYEQRDIESMLFDHRFNDLTDTSGYRDGYPITDPSWVPFTETDAFSFYISDKMQLTTEFSLTAGLRYDSTEYSPEVDDTFVDASGISVVDSSFDALVGELIAEYEFMPNNFLLASYSQGYRAPSVQDLYLDTNNTTSTITNPETGVEYQDLDTIANADLEAEEAASFEIGYKLATESASVTITAYKTEYDNLIESVSLFTPYDTTFSITPPPSRFNPNPQPITYSGDEYRQKQNVGKVDVDGIEIDASYAFTDNLYTRVTFATIDGEHKNSGATFDKGDVLATAAPDSGTWTLGYQADGDKWGAALHVLWFDKIDEHNSPDPDDSTVIPGDRSIWSLNNGSGPAHYPESYTVVDLTAFYEITDDLLLTAAAYNLTDKEYYRWEVLNSIRPGFGGFFGGVSGDGYKRYSEPGRSVSVSLSYTF